MAETTARAHSRHVRTHLVAALLMLALGTARAARAQSTADPDLSGLIIEEPVPAVDAGNAAPFDSVSGVREPQPLAADVEQRLDELSAQRAAAAESGAAGAAAAPPLPSEPGAPARVDAGSGDPDWLRGLPAPPAVP